MDFIIIALFVGAVLAQAGSPPQPQSIEGSIHVPKDTGADDYADNVRKANDHGCNDCWAIFIRRIPTYREVF